ncbi:Uncharacterized protein DAT39_020207, partial [Clarias magur]
MATTAVPSVTVPECASHFGETDGLMKRPEVKKSTQTQRLFHLSGTSGADRGPVHEDKLPRMHCCDMTAVFLNK